MARDYVEILKRVEAHYPQASSVGLQNDPNLVASITGFANDLIEEIDREQRWLLEFGEIQIQSVLGQQSYAFPYPTGTTNPFFNSTFIDRVWLSDPTTGRITRMQRFTKEELQRVYGDPIGDLVTNLGQPKYYTIESPATNTQGSPLLQLTLYPCPDGNGPNAGNYNVNISGYFSTPPIIEVQGSTTALSATLTVPSGTPTFLQNLGEPTNGTTLGLGLSVRKAGSPGIGGLADTHVTSWTAMPSATTITMSLAAPATSGSVQVFFNSTNWIIQHWPKVLIFGICREIASYYGDQQAFQLWETRYQDQLQRLRDWEFDRSRSMDARAIAYAGADASGLRTIDSGIGLIDVRGGSDGDF